jgi:polysaccharide transporter, PST family
MQDLHGRVGLKKIFVNVSWLFFDKILRMGVGLVIGAWVARHLGPGNFGIYNYAIALASIFSIVATLGLDSIIVQRIVKNPEDTEVLLSTTFVSRFLAGILSFLLCILTVYVLSNGEEPIVLQVSFIVSLSLLGQSFDTIDLYFQSQVKSKYIVIAKNISFVLLAIVKLFLLLNKATLPAFAWTYTAEVVLNALFMLVLFKRHLPGMSLLKFQLSKSIQLLKASWSLVFSGLIITVYMRTDQIMLKEMLGNVAVGIYSVGVRISEVWYFIPGVIMTSVFPSIIKAKESDPILYMERLQRLYTGMTWVSISIALLVMLFSEQIIYFLFRENYSDAALVLSLHVWTGVFVFQGTARGYWLLTENLQVYGMIYTGGACVMNVGLNYWLIPRYGPNGAAVATLISYFCSVIFFPLFVNKTRASSIQLLKSFLWKMK